MATDSKLNTRIDFKAMPGLRDAPLDQTIYVVLTLSTRSFAASRVDSSRTRFVSLGRDRAGGPSFRKETGGAPGGQLEMRQTPRTHASLSLSLSLCIAFIDNATFHEVPRPVTRYYL